MIDTETERRWAATVAGQDAPAATMPESETTPLEVCQILLAWEAGELSEGQAARALQTDRVTLRMQREAFIQRGTQAGAMRSMRAAPCGAQVAPHGKTIELTIVIPDNWLEQASRTARETLQTRLFLWASFITTAYAITVDWSNLFRWKITVPEQHIAAVRTSLMRDVLPVSLSSEDVPSVSFTQADDTATKK